MGFKKIKFGIKMPKERKMLKAAGLPGSVNAANKVPKGIKWPKARKTLHKRKFF